MFALGVAQCVIHLIGESEKKERESSTPQLAAKAARRIFATAFSKRAARTSDALGFFFRRKNLSLKQRKMRAPSRFSEVQLLRFKCKSAAIKTKQASFFTLEQKCAQER